MVLPPRHGLSLCAGGGGLDMGLGLAEPGFATTCYVEWEDYPRQSLIAGQRAGYLHTAPIWDNVKTFSARPWRGIIDTVIAGYPCQPFSQAGQRRGADDPRHLWPDIERIVGEIEPRWCFFENVAGHISLGLETVVRALRGLGYRVSAGLFSAEETGAPHERQRVFIVAYREGADRRGKFETGRAGGGRSGPAGIGPELADPDGGNPGPERQQRRGQQRLHTPGGRTGGGDGAELVNAPGKRRDKRRAEPEFRGGRSAVGGANRELDHPAGARCDGAGQRAGGEREGGQCLPGAGCPELADSCPDADARGLVTGSNRSGSGQGEREREKWQRVRAGPWGNGRQLHAPGPADMDTWRAVLDLAPDLAPALSVGDIKAIADRAAQMVARGIMAQAAAESLVCRMADGLAARPRALRLLGNGVHPLAAAYAWRTLSASHGLGPVDMGTTTGRPAGTGEAVGDVLG